MQNSRSKKIRQFDLKTAEFSLQREAALSPEQISLIEGWITTKRAKPDVPAE